MAVAEKIQAPGVASFKFVVGSQSETHNLRRRAKQLYMAMNRISALLIWVALALTAVGQTVDLPTEVTLKSGAMLRKVVLVRLEKDRAVLKHAGGVDPVRFENMAPASAQAFAAYIADQEKPRTYKGSIYVVTRGAGNYKLGNVAVFILPQPKSVVRQTYKSLTEARPPADAKLVRSGADGHFQFKWQSAGTFTICVYATRLAGSSSEQYLWLIERSEITDSDDVQLSNHNMTDI